MSRINSLSGISQQYNSSRVTNRAIYNGMFSQSGGNNSLSNMYTLASDYKLSQSSAYRNALKAYYKDDTSESSKTAVSSASSILDKLRSGNTEAKKYSDVKSDTSNLTKASQKLSAVGSKSIFNKVDVETTNEETGEKTTTKEYDKTTIIGALKDFVKEYNDVIDSANETQNSSVIAKGNTMASKTNFKADALAEIGITVGSDAKLTIDEDKLANADFDKVKELFNGSSSYGYGVGQDSFYIGQTAVREASYAGANYSFDWYI